MLHKHRILPGHLGGSYEPDNVELLTIEQHAEAHRLLWENFGCPQDRLAWRMLSGQISREELQRERCRLGGYLTGIKNRGRKRIPYPRKPQTPEWRRNIGLASGKARLGKKRGPYKQRQTEEQQFWHIS